MERTDELYDWYVSEIPVEKRKGVERLLDAGYHGLAEKHAVKSLRMKLGRVEGKIKVTGYGASSWL